MPLLDQLGNNLVPNNNNNTGILTGNDQTISLFGGNDVLENIIGSGNTVNGNAGNDFLDGTDGTANTLNGNEGNDTLKGGRNGTLDDGTGRDVIYAGSGNTINLGTGRDVVYIATAITPPDPNTITGFNPTLDVLRISLLPGVDNAAEDLTFTEADGNTTISFGTDDIAIVNGTITAANVEVITVERFVPPTLLNTAPVFSEDSYTFDNSGTVVATDPDQDELTYRIAEGENAGLFSINAKGEITIVANTTDFPIGQTKTITVEVTDGALTDTATVEVTRTQDVLFSLDVDGNNDLTAANDAGLITRYMFSRELGFTLTDAQIGRLVDDNGSRNSADLINNYLATAYDNSLLDVDGNNDLTAANDAGLITRYMFSRELGFTLTDAQIGRLVDDNGSRNSADLINNYLADFYVTESSIL